MDLIQLKRGLENAWKELNPILESGEVGVIFDDSTGKAKGIKIGDGNTPYSDLKFIGAGGSSGGISEEEAAEILAQAKEYTNNQISANNSLVVLLRNLGATNAILQGVSTDENLDIIFNGVNADSGLPFTFNFTNLLKQEGVLERIGLNIASDIETLKVAVGNIQKLIPANADANNPLITQKDAETLVSQGNGLIIASNASGAAFATKAALEAGPYFSSGEQITDIPVRSTAIVLSDSGYQGAQTRYAWDGSQWVYQGTLSAASFTQAQQDALNSGVSKTVLQRIQSDLSSNQGAITAEQTRAEGREAAIAGDVQKNKTAIEKNAGEIASANTEIGAVKSSLNNKLDKFQPNFKNAFLGVNDDGSVTGFSDAPSDGKQYSRQNGGWEESQVSTSDPFYLSTIQKFQQVDEINKSQTDKITAIENKIPSAASKTNPLVDEKTMRDAIASSSGAMLSSNTAGAPFETLGALTGAETFYSGGVAVTPNTNDKVTVLRDETHDGATTQYIYSGGKWTYYTTLSSQAFNEAQMEAVNSGITAEKLTKINTDIQENKTSLSGKADKIVAFTNVGTISTAGSGYKVNDVVTFSDGSESYNGVVSSTNASGGIVGIRFFDLPLTNLGGRAFSLTGGTGSGAKVTFTSSSSTKNLQDVYSEFSDLASENKIATVENTEAVNQIKAQIGTQALNTEDKTLTGAINEVQEKLSGVSLEADKVSYNNTSGLNSENVQEALDTLASSVTGRWKTNDRLGTQLGPDTEAIRSFAISGLTKLTSETQTPAIGQIISDPVGTEYIITEVEADTVTAVCIFVHAPENLANRNEGTVQTRVGNSSDTIIDQTNSSTSISSGVRFSGGNIELFYETATKVVQTQLQSDGIYLSVVNVGSTPSFKKLATVDDVNKKVNKLTDTSTKLRAYTRTSAGVDGGTIVDTAATANSIAQRGINGVLEVGTPAKASDAATKKYVDDATQANAAEIETLQTGLTAEIDRAKEAEAANATSASTNAAAIKAINDKLPEGEIATKAFVNSSVTSQAARYITPEGGGQWASFEALTAPGTAYFYAGEPTSLTQNDYAVYLKTKSDGAEEQYRAVYQGGSWSSQYKIGSAFTNQQSEALNSGITESLVEKLVDLPSPEAADSGKLYSVGEDGSPTLIENTFADKTAVDELQSDVAEKASKPGGVSGNLVSVGETGDIKNSGISVESVNKAVENSLITITVPLDQDQSDVAINTTEFVARNNTKYVSKRESGAETANSEMIILTVSSGQILENIQSDVPVLFGKYDSGITYFPGTVKLVNCRLKVLTNLETSYEVHNSQIDFSENTGTTTVNEGTKYSFHHSDVSIDISGVDDNQSVIVCKSTTINYSGKGNLVFYGNEGSLLEGTVYWHSGDLTINNNQSNTKNNLIVYKTEDFGEGALQPNSSPAMLIDLRNENLRDLGKQIDKISNALSNSKVLKSGNTGAEGIFESSIDSNVLDDALLNYPIQTINPQAKISEAAQDRSILSMFAQFNHVHATNKYGEATTTAYGHVRYYDSQTLIATDGVGKVSYTVASKENLTLTQYLAGEYYFSSTDAPTNADLPKEYLTSGVYGLPTRTRTALLLRVKSVFAAADVLSVTQELTDVDTGRVWSRTFKCSTINFTKSDQTSWKIISSIDPVTINITATTSQGSVATFRYWKGSSGAYYCDISLADFDRGIFPIVKTFVTSKANNLTNSIAGLEETYDSPIYVSGSNIRVFSNASVALTVKIW